MPDSALNSAEQYTPQPVKTNLLGLSVSKLGDFFEQLGEKRFSRHTNGEVDSSDG
jgi:hypothetical protein